MLRCPECDSFDTISVGVLIWCPTCKDHFEDGDPLTRPERMLIDYMKKAAKEPGGSLSLPGLFIGYKSDRIDTWMVQLSGDRTKADRQRKLILSLLHKRILVVFHYAESYGLEKIPDISTKELVTLAFYKDMVK